MQHPEAELIAFMRGELVGPAHDRVARHLESCPSCRAVRDDFRVALVGLRDQAVTPGSLRLGRGPDPLARGDIRDTERGGVRGTLSCCED